jgi:5'-3' exonuclease
MTQTLHLIDASLYVFRAWHSMPPHFSDRDGAPVNAVHGFTRFLCDFLERAKPTHALAAFDESLTSSFRNNIYPAYKANRELPPAELLVQFAYCKRIAAALGLTVLSDLYYEADDLIGSAVVRVRGEGFRTVIVSADKDFGQMIGIDDEQWDFSKNERWDAAGVKRRRGVRPDQVADFLALTGDSVDNIPGVPGIGAKTAPPARTFDSLDAMLAHRDSIRACAARSGLRSPEGASRAGAAVAHPEPDRARRAGAAAGRAPALGKAGSPGARRVVRAAEIRTADAVTLPSADAVAAAPAAISGRRFLSAPACRPA